MITSQVHSLSLTHTYIQSMPHFLSPILEHIHIHTHTLSLSLSLPHTHTKTNTISFSHPFLNTRALALSFSFSIYHTHTCTQAHSLTLFLSLSHTLLDTYIISLLHLILNTRTLTHTHKHTYTYSHTHKHTLALSLSLFFHILSLLFISLLCTDISKFHSLSFSKVSLLKLPKLWKKGKEVAAICLDNYLLHSVMSNVVLKSTTLKKFISKHLIRSFKL